MSFSPWRRLQARRAVRVKREHLAVLWALNAYAGAATSIDLARLVAPNPSRVLVHLHWMVERGHVRKHPPGTGQKLTRFSLTPQGETFIANLIEDLLETANSWGGARRAEAKS
jgi:DNA-binding MarR family transcriptional regulator